MAKAKDTGATAVLDGAGQAGNDGAKSPPVHKVGPFRGGWDICLWRNTTQNGRPFHSFSISPRRYKTESGEFADAKSWPIIDIETMILALQKMKAEASRIQTMDDVQGTAVSDTPF